MDNRYNRHNRRKYSLKVHIVLVTKYRKQLLNGNISDDVKQKIFSSAAVPSWLMTFGSLSSTNAVL